MSAINGIFERGESGSLDASIGVSSESLTDYGRDGRGHWISGSIALGHQYTRMVPGDETENLPFRDAAAGVVITTDARIDNRPELFEELGIRSANQQAFTDSRLIISAWQKWGRDCPRHLVGDYTFAIWDERRRTIFCARDHIGSRPFYYCLTDRRYIFATDIKGVLAVPGVSDQLDEEYAIAALADKGFYRKDRTYFAAIRKLPPGYSLTVDSGTEKLEQFWFPEENKSIRFKNDEDYAEAAREIYSRAVNDRLRTVEKVGVHLSGGLDSSSVAVLAARERRRQGLPPPVVLSWQPPPDGQSPPSREHRQIEMVCAQEKLVPLYCPLDARDLLEILKKDPVRDATHVTLLVEKTIQRRAEANDVRLLLSGWGGDEGLSFDGRGYYAQLLLSGRLWRLFWESRKFGNPFKFIAMQTILLMFRDRNEGLKKIADRSLKNRTLVASLLNPSLERRITLRKIPCRETSIRSTLFWLWQRGSLADRMESWAAHGASCGFTYAYPLSDRRLLDFIAGLPPEQFVRGKWTRYIMREAMRGILPEDIRLQPDKGEPVRVSYSGKIFSEVMKTVRTQIIDSEKRPERAAYLNMTDLLERIRPEALAERGRFGDIIRALLFLDF